MPRRSQTHQLLRLVSLVTFPLAALILIGWFVLPLFHLISAQDSADSAQAPDAPVIIEETEPPAPITQRIEIAPRQQHDQLAVALVGFEADDAFYQSQVAADQLAQVIQLLLADQNSRPDIRWVDRTRIESAASELGLSAAQSNAGSALALGNWVGADLLVSGRIFREQADRSLQIEIIDVRHADVRARTSLTLPGVPEQPLDVPADTVDLITNRIAELIGNAWETMHADTDKARIAALFFRNVSPSARLNHLEHLLLFGLEQRITSQLPIRLLRFNRTAQAGQENSMALSGLTLSNPNAWHDLADIYIWGEYEEEPGTYESFEQVPLTLRVWLWDGYSEPIQHQLAATVGTINDLNDQLATLLTNAEQNDDRKWVSPQARDRVAKLLTDQIDWVRTELRRVSGDNRKGEFAASLTAYSNTLSDVARFFAPNDPDIILNWLNLRRRNTTDPPDPNLIASMILSIKGTSDTERQLAAQLFKAYTMPSVELHNSKTYQRDVPYNIRIQRQQAALQQATQLFLHAQRWHIPGTSDQAKAFANPAQGSVYTALGYEYTTPTARANLIRAAWPLYAPRYREQIARQESTDSLKGATESRIFRLFDQINLADQALSLLELPDDNPRQQIDNDTPLYPGGYSLNTIEWLEERQNTELQVFTLRSRELWQQIRSGQFTPDAAQRENADNPAPPQPDTPPLHTAWHPFYLDRDTNPGTQYERRQQRDEITATAIDPFGRLWVGVRNIRVFTPGMTRYNFSLYIVDPVTDEIIDLTRPVELTTQINDITFTNGHAYLATEGQWVIRINARSLATHRYTGNDGVLDINTRAIIRHNNKLLFISELPALATLNPLTDTWGQIQLTHAEQQADPMHFGSGNAFLDLSRGIWADSPSAITHTASIGPWIITSSVPQRLINTETRQALYLHRFLYDRLGPTLEPDVLQRYPHWQQLDPRLLAAARWRISSVTTTDDGFLLSTGAEILHFNPDTNTIQRRPLPHTRPAAVTTLGDKYFLLGSPHKPLEPLAELLPAEGDNYFGYTVPPTNNAPVARPDSRLTILQPDSLAPLAQLPLPGLYTTMLRSEHSLWLLGHANAPIIEVPIPSLADALHAPLDLKADNNANNTNNAKPDPTDYPNPFPLILAAYRNDLTDIDRLLAAGANPNQATERGWTALHAAARRGHTQAVVKLLAAGADPAAPPDDPNTNRDDNIAQPVAVAAAWSGSVPTLQLLHQAGADLSTHTPNFDSPLSVAAQRGDLFTTRQLLQWHATPDIVDHLGLTPLAHAAKRNDLTTLQLLLDSGAINLESDPQRHIRTARRGFSPIPALHAALLAGNIEAAQLLLQNGANPNTPIPLPYGIKRTPIDFALRNGNTPLIRLLLHHAAVVPPQLSQPIQAALNTQPRADINNLPVSWSQRQTFGLTLRIPDHPFINAARRGDLNQLATLITQGLNLNTPIESSTLGIEALCLGNVAALPFLIEAGIPINGRDVNGLAPLHHAALGYGAHKLDILLRLGADPRLTTPDGSTVFELADPQSQSLLTHYRGIRPDSNTNSPVPRNPHLLSIALHQAVGNRDTQTVRLLLQAGASPTVVQYKDPAFLDTLNQPPTQPIHIAALTGQTQTLALLLEHGANPDQPGHNLWTPLMYAAAQGHVQAAQLLIHSGAQLGAHNLHGQRPYDLALASNNQNIINLLQPYEVSPEARAFIDAARIGSNSSLANMIRSSYPINAVDEDGQTAAFHAALNPRRTGPYIDDHTALETLASFNADLTIRDRFNRSALIHAKHSGGYISSTNLATLFVRGLGPNDYDENNTPLPIAAQRNDWKTILRYIESPPTGIERLDEVDPATVDPQARSTIQSITELVLSPGFGSQAAQRVFARRMNEAKQLFHAVPPQTNQQSPGFTPLTLNTYGARLDALVFTAPQSQLNKVRLEIATTRPSNLYHSYITPLEPDTRPTNFRGESAYVQQYAKEATLPDFFIINKHATANLPLHPGKQYAIWLLFTSERPINAFYRLTYFQDSP